MDFITIFFIALGLSMDALAVSITNGIIIKNIRVIHAFRIALFFGLFQSFMPAVGWLAGLGLKGFISGVDHWIAFGLLSIIGAKMIYESFKLDAGKDKNESLNTYMLLVLSVATSIDALAVGFTLAFLNVVLILPVAIIGLVTFGISFMGVYAGNKFGSVLGNRMEIIGGLILIGIGLKILIQHLFYA
jgi:putative Mn2+ efflux pump MntP